MVLSRTWKVFIKVLEAIPRVGNSVRNYSLRMESISDGEKFEFWAINKNKTKILAKEYIVQILVIYSLAESVQLRF